MLNLMRNNDERNYEKDYRSFLDFVDKNNTAQKKQEEYISKLRQKSEQTEKELNEQNNKIKREEGWNYFSVADDLIKKEDIEKMEKFNAEDSKNFKEKVVACKKLEKSELSDKKIIITLKNPKEKDGGVFGIFNT